MHLNRFRVYTRIYLTRRGISPPSPYFTEIDHVDGNSMRVNRLNYRYYLIVIRNFEETFKKNLTSNF